MEDTKQSLGECEMKFCCATAEKICPQCEKVYCSRHYCAGENCCFMCEGDTREDDSVRDYDASVGLAGPR